MAVESGARASNTLSGELRSRPLPVLLAGACERGTSGTFTFRHGDRFDTLTMRLGKIAVVRTSEPIAYLGGVLYELGLIDMPTLNDTLHEVARAKRLHGDVLVERDALTREQVEEGLAEQTFRKVHHLFTLPDQAKWTFRADVDELANARDDDRPAVETWPAIWRGLRDQALPEHVRRTLVKVDGGVHLRDMRGVARFGLGAEEMALCERLHAQPTTLERVMTTTPLAADRTSLLIYILALSRCLVRVEAEPVGPLELGVEGVRARAARLDREDAYGTLGLRADASAEAARAAYFRIARLWHNDRIPAALDEVRAECARIFTRLGEAHRTVANKKMLSHADAILRASGAPPGMPANDSIAPPPDTVRATMRDVDAALARNDLAAAETIARSLTSAGNDGPSARAVIAWCACGASVGANADTGAVERAVAALDKVLTGDPDCVRALFYRGQLSKRLGRIDAAIRDHRRVIRLEPRHVDAQREVRLYDIRRRTDSTQLPSIEAPLASIAGQSPQSKNEKEPSAAETSVRSGLRLLLARVAGK